MGGRMYPIPKRMNTILRKLYARKKRLHRRSAMVDSTHISQHIGRIQCDTLSVRENRSSNVSKNKVENIFDDAMLFAGVLCVCVSSISSHALRLFVARKTIMIFHRVGSMRRRTSHRWHSCSFFFGRHCDKE